jgi:hypothetical protein
LVTAPGRDEANEQDHRRDQHAAIRSWLNAAAGQGCRMIGHGQPPSFRRLRHDVASCEGLSQYRERHEQVAVERVLDRLRGAAADSGGRSGIRPLEVDPESLSTWVPPYSFSP